MNGRSDAKSVILLYSDQAGILDMPPEKRRMTGMDALQTAQYARALYTAHGDRAEAEAAQKMRECEAAGHTREAQNWQAVRSTIRQIRGPNQA